MKYLIGTIAVFGVCTFFNGLFIIPLTLFSLLLIFERLKDNFMVRLTQEGKDEVKKMREDLNAIKVKIGIMK